MGVRELLIGAIVLGGVGGYVWSVIPPAAPTYSRPDASVRFSKDAPSPALVEVPPTTDEAAADSAWSAGEPAPDASREASSTHARRAIEQSAMYSAAKRSARSARPRSTPASRAIVSRWTATATASPANPFAADPPSQKSLSYRRLTVP